MFPFRNKNKPFAKFIYVNYENKNKYCSYVFLFEKNISPNSIILCRIKSFKNSLERISKSSNFPKGFIKNNQMSIKY